MCNTRLTRHSLRSGRRTLAVVSTKKRTQFKAKVLEEANAIMIGAASKAIQVREKGGASFKISTCSTPKVGAIVTFKFEGRTKTGTPRSPVFVGSHQDKKKLMRNMYNRIALGPITARRFRSRRVA